MGWAAGGVIGYDFKDALVRNGVPAQAVTVIGKGESQLLVPTGDNVREPQNRRCRDRHPVGLEPDNRKGGLRAAFFAGRDSALNALAIREISDKVIVHGQSGASVGSGRHHP
jgi:hypothetical protein